MSEIKVNSIKGVSATSAAISINNTDGTCTANITSIGGGQLANRNVIINGAALVAQRGDTLSGTTTGGYATDRFQCVMNETGTLTVSQDSNAPSGFSKSHKLTQTTAQGSLAANDLTTFRYNVEGFDVQRFKKGTSDAQQFTLSFFVKSVDQSSYPVTYIVELRDPINTRSCCKSYTVTASDTWEYKTLTFPADTTGTWAANNTKALEINWFVAAGSNYTSGTLSTSWASTVNANRAAGLTANLSANTANRFYLTGVQLEVGSVATDFEHRSFAQELELCRRYFQVLVDDGASKSFGNGTCFSSTNMHLIIQLNPEMRATPTLDYTTGSNYYSMFRDDAEDQFDAFVLQSTSHKRAVDLFASGGASGSQGASALLRTNNSDAKIRYSAEL